MTKDIRFTRPDLGFWRGRRVFVTGHTGFKGSWLCLWLHRLGAQVTGFSLPPHTNPSMFEVASVYEKLSAHHTGDIREYLSLFTAIREARPQVVFHMAAQPLVRLSYEQPVETYATNVIGTAHLLEAVRNTSGVEAVVNITTDKCYENREWVWGYREADPLGGYDPYSSSKACSEIITSAYRSSYFNKNMYKRHNVAIASARAGNVIGGGDWAKDRLIPDAIKAFISDEPVLIRSPNSIRPWQHVLDPLCGYLLLAERLVIDGPDFGEPWNFGPLDSDARSVQWIIEKVAKSWGYGARWKLNSAEHPHEAHFLKLDISKASARLRWNPALDISNALDWVVCWHRMYMSGANMQAFTLEQISEYERLADHA